MSKNGPHSLLIAGILLGAMETGCWLGGERGLRMYQACVSVAAAAYQQGEIGPAISRSSRA